MRAGLGRVLFRLNLPIIRRILNGSTRVRIVILSPDERQVLLVRNLLGRQRWSLPGGGVRPLETGEQAAQRELVEELGIHLAEADFRVLNSFDHYEVDTGASWRAVIAACHIPRASQLKLRRTEILAYGWFDRQELPDDLTQLATSVLANYPA